MRLSSLAWRGLRARPLRTGLAIVGVALGVGVVAATAIAGQAADQALRSGTTELLGRADLRLRAFDEAGFTPRTVQAIRAVEGVITAAPVAERRMQASAVSGATGQVFTLLVIGIDPDVDAGIRDLDLAAGRVLTSADAAEALVPVDLAARRRLELGDELRLTGRRPDASPLRIVGLLEPTGLASLERGELMITGRAALDASFVAPAPIRYLDLDLAPDREDDAQREIVAALDEPYVIETPADTAARLAAAQASFASIALLFGLVALVVGAFLVGNTLAISVGERTREIGLLRAAGTSGRQVLALVLRQGLMIGVAGTALGLLVGVALAAAMIAVLRATRAALAEGLPLPPQGLLLAVVLGLGVTLLAALAPAARAAAISPLHALRPSQRAGEPLAQRLRWLVLAELVVVALGMLIFPRQAGGQPLLPIILSLGLLLGGAVAAAFLLEPLGGVIGRPFEWFFGAQGLLGRANLSRDRARTGLTVGALMIALASVVALGTVAQSARAGAERWVASILPGGHAVRLVGPVEVDVVRPALESTAGLAVASAVLELPAVLRTDDAQREVSLAGIDATVFEGWGSLLIEGATRKDAFAALRGGGAALVPQSLARREALAVGDMIDIGLPGAEANPFRVAGLLEYTLPARSPDGAIVIAAADARELFGVTASALWAMVPQDGVAPSVFRGSVRETAALVAGEAIDAPQLAAELAGSLDRLLTLFDVLALIAVAIAAMGIVNTLSIGISERVREIAILRSHGMTVGQVQAMVVAEAAIMGAIGAVLAIATGLGVAWAMVGAGTRDFGAGLALPWGLLVAVVLVGTGVAVLAGLYPARVAARLPMIAPLKHFE